MSNNSPAMQQIVHSRPPVHDLVDLALHHDHRVQKATAVCGTCNMNTRSDAFDIITITLETSRALASSASLKQQPVQCRLLETHTHTSHTPHTCVDSPMLTVTV